MSWYGIQALLDFYVSTSESEPFASLLSLASTRWAAPPGPAYVVAINVDNIIFLVVNDTLLQPVTAGTTRTTGPRAV